MKFFRISVIGRTKPNFEITALSKNVLKQQKLEELLICNFFLEHFIDTVYFLSKQNCHSPKTGLKLAMIVYFFNNEIVDFGGREKNVNWKTTQSK